MLEKDLYIKELYELKHINDNELHSGFEYEDKMVERMTSEVLRRNPNLQEFLSLLQKSMVSMLESTLVLRNFFNHTIHKYYNRHNN